LVYRKPLPIQKSPRKGRKNGSRLVFKSEMRHQKLKTLMKTIFTNKVIMFEKTFEFNNAIIFYYGKWNFVILQQRIFKAKVWGVVEAITSTLNLVVLPYVMNQSRGH
jgi:hypothetical protein